jgi:transcriptional regulator with XRE-family HTH domain
MRTQKNLSQTQVAQELDVSQTAYNKWESDQTRPGIDNLMKISQFYETDIYDLLNDNAGDNIFQNNSFENSSFGGKYYSHNQYLSERLIDQYEARLKNLEEQVEYWKGLSGQ